MPTTPDNWITYVEGDPDFVPDADIAVLVETASGRFMASMTDGEWIDAYTDAPLLDEVRRWKHPTEEEEAELERQQAALEDAPIGKVVRYEPDSKPVVELTPIDGASLAALSEADLVERIVITYGEAQRLYRQSVAHAIMVGVLLSQAKETCSHGNFKQWIKEKVPNISYETANRYRKLAEAIRDQAKMARRAIFDAEEILRLPFLEGAAQEEALAKIEKITDGKSLSQLYFDFEVCKTPDRRGGKRAVSGPVQPPTPEEELEAIRDDWGVFMRTAIQYIEDEDQSWTQLPAIDRDTLVGILEPFVKKLKASLTKENASK